MPSGQGFGYGFYVIDRPGGDNTLSAAGTWGWAGAYSTTYRVDPKERLIMICMINQLPTRPDVVNRFPNVVYQALVRH
jgi:CubicO group peptidase (beta-lactamase class C family)